MGADGEGGEVAEAIGVGVGGSGGKLEPGEVVRVEEERGGDRRVLREDAEKMGETVKTAEGE